MPSGKNAAGWIRRITPDLNGERTYLRRLLRSFLRDIHATWHKDPDVRREREEGFAQFDPRARGLLTRMRRAHMKMGPHEFE